MQRYVETYAHFDPQSTLPLFEVEQIVSTVDLVPYDEFQEGRFYREWAEPQGFVDAANAVLEKSVASCAYLSVIRNQTQGMVDDAMRRRMGLIVPHVRRAVLISKVIDLKQAEAATFADVTDGLGAAMFLVDASARIVHANAAAQAMLASRDPIRTERGRLALRPAAVAAKLGIAVRQAANNEASKHPIPALGANGAPYVLHVLPLNHDELRPGLAPSAAAAIFVAPPVSPMTAPNDALAALFDLTLAESHVFAQIAEGKTQAEIARALDIEIGTVKTHLLHIFAKTGTHRQADLVRLAASMAIPLL